MIDVRAALEGMPHFETFCSVEKLEDLVERLQGDDRFEVMLGGTSAGGRPIHHVRVGKGRVKALFVGFPHCKEPICGLTVFSLLSLLEQGNRELWAADVEWHVVPCIDPDGALLNEEWTQKPLTMERYMKNFYVQALRDQVDTSFAVRHKRLVWDTPSHEANVLKDILDRVLPDFFYSLHNAWTGGAFYFISRDNGAASYEQLHGFLRAEDFPLQTRPIWRDVCRPYAPGVVDLWSIKKHYDHLEKTLATPERYLPFGGGSWDYLQEIKPEAITLITEMGYVRHPGDESNRDTGHNLRQFKLKIDADSKYLATVLLEEWNKVKEHVDRENPLYRAVEGGGCMPTREALNEGGRPLSMHPTQDVLFNTVYDRPMTEGDRFQACMVDGGFWFLCHSYQVVRLLKASPPIAVVKQAIERLEKAFDEVLDRIKAYVDFSAFEVFFCDRLARIHLGSGLIVLNSILGKGAKAP